MSATKRSEIILSRPSDWFDWYDNLLTIARESDLEDLVNINNKNLDTEILLPKPEKPNPLKLFPNLLEFLSPAALRQVVTPVVDDDGTPTKPGQLNFIRNQEIEDDALIHLTSAQAAGWGTRLNMYNLREREWRQQQTKVLALRKWIDNHVDPAYVYRIRSIEDIPQVIQALRRIFPASVEQGKIYDEYCAVLAKAGPPLPAEEWLRQWNLAYGRARRYVGERFQEDDTLDCKDFLQAAGEYDYSWAVLELSRQVMPDELRERGGTASEMKRKNVVELADDFAIFLQVEKLKFDRQAPQSDGGASCAPSTPGNETGLVRPRRRMSVRAVQTLRPTNRRASGM